ncbi:hypothetical protein [Trueperella bialowiezensis]|uniref:Uncharacterized protein n=1 Tax=Trueperella bialowiezensis TaxID=312285 RepID=A0A448PCA4_9ACTO|nr:hypothetical protein [Trueperella bialowiezensis]VEI12568.1 Uncharacterised protein [Trueperella bialowiezensis]
MFKRKKLPAHLADEHGTMPAAATPVEPETEGTWIAGWNAHFAVVPKEGERTVYTWSDFEAGTWDDDTDTLSLIFIDPRNAPLTFRIPRHADPTAITMIRERIDRSIVHRQVEELPSGAIARGQVRRNPDDTLFTQIIVDDEVTDEDRIALDVFENQLREAVGLDII